MGSNHGEHCERRTLNGIDWIEWYDISTTSGHQWAHLQWEMMGSIVSDKSSNGINQMDWSERMNQMRLIDWEIYGMNHYTDESLIEWNVDQMKYQVTGKSFGWVNQIGIQMDWFRWWNHYIRSYIDPNWITHGEHSRKRTYMIHTRIDGTEESIIQTDKIGYRFDWITNWMESAESIGKTNQTDCLEPIRLDWVVHPWGENMGSTANDESSRWIDRLDQSDRGITWMEEISISRLQYLKGAILGKWTYNSQDGG